MPFTRTLELLSFSETMLKGWFGSVAAHITFPYNGFADSDFSAIGSYTHTVAITATINSSYTGFSQGSGSAAWADQINGLHIAFANPATAFTITETLTQPSGTVLTRVRTLPATQFAWLSGDSGAGAFPGFAMTYACSYNNGVAGIHVFNIKVFGAAFNALTPRSVTIGTSPMTVGTNRVDMQSNAVNEGLSFQWSMMPRQSVKVNWNPKDITNTAVGGIKAFLYLGDSFVPDPTNFHYVDTSSATAVGNDYPDTATAAYILEVTSPVTDIVLTLPTRCVFQRYLDASGFHLVAAPVDTAQRRLRIVVSKENFGFSWGGSTTLWQKLWQSLIYQPNTETTNPIWRLPDDAGCTNVAVTGSAKLVQTLAMTIASVSHTGGTTQAVAGGFKLTATTQASFQLNLQNGAQVQMNASPYRHLRFDVTAQSPVTVTFAIDDFGNGATIGVVPSTKGYAVALVAGPQTIWIDLMDPVTVAVNGVPQTPLPTIEDEKLYDLSHGSAGRYNGIRGMSALALSFANNVLTFTNVALDTKDKTSSRGLGYVSGNGTPWRIHNDGKNAVELVGSIASFMGFSGALGMNSTTALSVTLPAQSPVTAAQAQNVGFIDPIDANINYIGELDFAGASLYWSYSPGVTIEICPAASVIPLLTTDWWKVPIELTAVSNWGSVFAQTIVPDSTDTSHVDYRLGTAAPLFSLPIADSLGTHHGYARAATQYMIGNLAPAANPALTQYVDPAVPITIALWQVSGQAIANPLWHHTRMGPLRPGGMHVCCDPTGVFHLAYINLGKAMHRAFDLRPTLASGYALTNQASPSGVSVQAVQIAWAPHGTLTICYQEVGTNRIMQVESPDFGRSWEAAAQLIVTGGTNPAFDIDPTTGARYCAAYVGTGWRLFRKDSDGASWTNVAAIPHSGPAAQSGIRVSTQKDHRLEFVSADAAGVLRIYSSLDRGASWTQEN